MVWYKIGGADDPAGKSGLAHFLEHLMFKGTPANPPGAFTALISRNGGRNNAFTTQDYTAYHETISRDRLDPVMRLEADRMTGLVLDDKVVSPERDVVLEERRMRVDNEPASLLAEQLRAALFLHHPYRNPNIGWEHEIRELGTADALAFYRNWYAPNNAILIIAGDIGAVEARALADRHFGAIAARPLPPRGRVGEPPHHAAIRVEMKARAPRNRIGAAPISLRATGSAKRPRHTRCKFSQSSSAGAPARGFIGHWCSIALWRFRPAPTIPRVQSI